MSSIAPPTYNILKAAPGYSLPHFNTIVKDTFPPPLKVCDGLPVISDDEISEDSEHSVSDEDGWQDEGLEVGDCDEEEDDEEEDEEEEKAKARKEMDGLDFEEPDWKRKGMTSSRDPSDRSIGYSKDSLFGERYGRVPGAIDRPHPGDGEEGSEDGNEDAMGGDGGDDDRNGDGGGGGRDLDESTATHESNKDFGQVLRPAGEEVWPRAINPASTSGFASTTLNQNLFPKERRTEFKRMIPPRMIRAMAQQRNGHLSRMRALWLNMRSAIAEIEGLRGTNSAQGQEIDRLRQDVLEIRDILTSRPPLPA